MMKIRKGQKQTFKTLSVIICLSMMMPGASFAGDLPSDHNHDLIPGMQTLQPEPFDQHAPYTAESSFVDETGIHLVSDTFAFVAGENRLIKRDFWDDNRVSIDYEYSSLLEVFGVELFVYVSKETTHWWNDEVTTEEYSMNFLGQRHLKKKTNQHDQFNTEIWEYSNWGHLISHEQQRTGVSVEDQYGDFHSIIESTVDEYETTLFDGTYRSKTTNNVSGITTYYMPNGVVDMQDIPDFIPKKVYETQATPSNGFAPSSKETYAWLYGQYLLTGVDYLGAVIENGYPPHTEIQYEWSTDGGSLHIASETCINKHNGQITITQFTHPNTDLTYVSAYGTGEYFYYDTYNDFYNVFPLSEGQQVLVERYSVTTYACPVSEDGEGYFADPMGDALGKIGTVVYGDYRKDVWEWTGNDLTKFTSSIKTVKNNHTSWQTSVVEYNGSIDHPTRYTDGLTGIVTVFNADGSIASRTVPGNLPQTKTVLFSWGETRQYALNGGNYRETKRITSDVTTETEWLLDSDGHAFVSKQTQYGTYGNIIPGYPTNGYRIVTEYTPSSYLFGSIVPTLGYSVNFDLNDHVDLDQFLMGNDPLRYHFGSHYNERISWATKTTIYDKNGTILGIYELLVNPVTGTLLGYREIRLTEEKDANNKPKYIIITHSLDEILTAYKDFYSVNPNLKQIYKEDKINPLQTYSILAYLNQSKRRSFGNSFEANNFETSLSGSIFAPLSSKDTLQNTLSRSMGDLLKPAPFTFSVVYISDATLKSQLSKGFNTDDTTPSFTKGTTSAVHIEDTKVRQGELSVADIMDRGTVKASFDLSNNSDVDTHSANLKDMATPTPRGPNVALADINLVMSPNDSADDSKSKLSLLNDVQLNSRVALLGSLNSGSGSKEQNSSSSNMTMEAYLNGASPVSKSLDRLLKKNPSVSIDAMRVKFEADPLSLDKDDSSSFSSYQWEDVYSSTVGKHLPVVAA